MEKSDLSKEVIAKAAAEAVSVHPRTLEIRTLKYWADSPAGKIAVNFFGVYGRANKDAELDIWTATFFDYQEAQAWVMASKTFGRPILGGRVGAQQTGEKIDGTGDANAKTPDQPAEDSGGVGGEARGTGAQG